MPYCSWRSKGVAPAVRICMPLVCSCPFDSPSSWKVVSLRVDFWGGPSLYSPAQSHPNRTFPKPKVLGPGVGIYLGHFLPVGLGVQGRLGEQGWMLFRGNTKFIVERVVPDLVGVGGGEETQWCNVMGTLPTPKKDQNELNETRSK